MYHQHCSALTVYNTFFRCIYIYIYILFYDSVYDADSFIAGSMRNMFEELQLRGYQQDGSFKPVIDIDITIMEHISLHLLLSHRNVYYTYSIV